MDFIWVGRNVSMDISVADLARSKSLSIYNGPFCLFNNILDGGILRGNVFLADHRLLRPWRGC